MVGNTARILQTKNIKASGRKLPNKGSHNRLLFIFKHVTTRWLTGKGDPTMPSIIQSSGIVLHGKIRVQHPAGTARV